MTVELPREVEAPGAARQAVTQFEEIVGPGRINDLRLLTSELVTNAVKYGGEGDLSLRMSVTGRRLRVEVVDQGSGFEAQRTAHERDRDDLDQVGGWGLPIVEQLASDWGSFEGSTHVWFEFDL